MSPLFRRLLLTTVFITGAAVLIFEVGAMRLLAPYYGSSLTVVSSVLSIILLALSLGYYFGGRLADRAPHLSLLMLIIGSAGILMLGLLYTALSVLPTLAPALGQSTGPLIISALIFFLPACLLGADSPFVSKILAHGTDNEGAVVGTVFFLSTIGSIVGSLAAGFYLIPTLGLSTTLALTGLVLVVWSMSVLCFSAFKNQDLRIRTIVLAGTLVCIALLITIISIKTPPHSRGQLIYQQDGLYSQLTVFEEEFRGTTYRFLKNDSNYSSAIIPGSDEIAFPYAALALTYPDMVADASSYLVLGGGAFTIPRHVHLDNPTITIDSVELEPYLLPLAEQYFELPTSTLLHNLTIDARVFLEQATTTYDVIFSDVMNSGQYIPPHLLTVEFFQSLKKALAPGGVAYLNYIGSLDTHGTSMTGSLIKTLTAVFPNYALVPITSTTDKKLQNIMIVVRHDGYPIRFADTTRIKNRLYSYDYAINDHLMTIPSETLVDEVVFTDNRPGMEPLLAKQFRLHN